MKGKHRTTPTSSLILLEHRSFTKNSSNFFFFVTYYFVHGSSRESAFSKRLNKTKQPVIIIARPFDTLLPKNAKFMVIMEQTSQKKDKKRKRRADYKSSTFTKESPLV